MPRTLSYKIDLNNLLYKLFCAYAFAMPYELILKQLFSIDTIFKPFRILSLLIIGFYVLKGLKERFYIKQENRVDLFLYAVFFYGILISMVGMIIDLFSMGRFYNTLFQSSLYLATFFIFKTLSISREQMIRLLKYFIAGILLNALYIFYLSITFSSPGRIAGFTDNPNYVALGIVAVATWLMLRLNQNNRKRTTLGLLIALFFCIYTIGITGSRTGLLMFVISGFFVFIFASLKTRLFLGFSVAMISLVLLSGPNTEFIARGPSKLIKRINKKLSEDEGDVRFAIWKGIFRALEKDGFHGFGIGQFSAKFPAYYTNESNKLILEIVNRGYFLSAHNDYLAILVDYGLPGLVFYLCFLWFSFKKLFRRLNYPSEDDNHALLKQFSFIIFCCLIIFGLAAENFQHQLFWCLLMFSTK